MDSHIGALKQRPLLWTVLVSLLIHLLLLLLFVRWGEGIFLNFTKTEELKPEKQIAFEIVETSENSKTPPEKADLLSDKNSLAKDQNPENTDSNLPFSKGLTDARVLERPSAYSNPAERTPPPESANQEQEATPAESSEGITTQNEVKQTRKSSFSRERLLAYQEPSQSTSRSFLDQQSGSARDFGGLSLNTYAWDYAPYLLDLKHRIEKNIFPPPVFTRMGSGGQNTFRFRIMPDGTLVGPEYIDAQGERALIATSENAIKYSVPFKPLPKDFPEPYLEITARFDYTIVGQP